MESKLSCPTNNCLVKAFGDKLCSFTRSKNCIIFDVIFNYIPVLKHNTDNDFSHGNKKYII